MKKVQKTKKAKNAKIVEAVEVVQSVVDTRDRIPALVAQRRKIFAQDGDKVVIKVFPLNFDPVGESNPITYSWRFNGGVIGDLTSDTYEFDMIPIHEGTYEITATQSHASGVEFKAKAYCAVVAAKPLSFTQYHVDNYGEHILEVFAGEKARIAPIVRLPKGKKIASYAWTKGGSVMEGETLSYLEIEGVAENTAVEFKCEVTYTDGTKDQTENGLELSIVSVDPALPEEVTSLAFEAVFVPEHGFSVLSLPSNIVEYIDGLAFHTNVADDFDNVLIGVIKEDAASGDEISIYMANMLYSFYHSLIMSTGRLLVKDSRDGYTSVYTPAMGKFESFQNPENLDRIYEYKYGSISYTRKPNVLNWF